MIVIVIYCKNDNIRNKNIFMHTSRKKSNMMFIILVIGLSAIQATAFFNLFPGSGDAAVTTTTTSGVADAGGSLSAGTSSIRGVAPSDAHLYSSISNFVCDNGKRTLPFSSINDGFCDCDDATDEPGTSACNSGKFKCINKGFKMITIPSSRVDDGICDCCDGSDEALLSHVKCANTCDKHAIAQRATMEKVVNLYRTGSSMRMQYIDEAGRAYADASNALSVLTTEESLLNQQKETQQAILTHETAIETAEKMEASRELNQKLHRVLGLETMATQPEQLGQVLRVLLDVLDVQPFSVDKLLSNIAVEGGEAAGAADVAVGVGVDGEAAAAAVDGHQHEHEHEHEHEHDDDDHDADDMVASESDDTTSTSTSTTTEAGSDDPTSWLTQLSPQDKAICHQLSASLTAPKVLQVCRYAAGMAGTSLPITSGSPSRIVVAAGELIKEVIADRRAYKEVQYALLGVLTGVGHKPPAITDSTTVTEPEQPPATDSMPSFYSASVVAYIQAHLSYDEAACLAEFPSEHHLCRLSITLSELYSNGYGLKFTYTREPTQVARNTLSDIENKLQNVKNRQKENEKTVTLYNEHHTNLPYLALKAQQPCYEVADGNFIYNMCLFDSVTQKERHGSSRTVTLGSFDSFSEDNDTGSSVMHFTKGTHCHAHGARRVDIQLTCGVTNKLKDPREPSTCFYTLEMETPAACTQKYAEVNGIYDALSNLS